MHSANQFVAVGEPTLTDDWSTAIVVTSPNNNAATALATPLTPDSEARLASEEAGLEVRFESMAFPNPVEKDFTLTINGAIGQPVLLWLVDQQGRTLIDRQIQVDVSSHQESMKLDN